MMLAVALLVAQQSAAPVNQCHFKVGAAIGCVEREENAPENAAALFQRYGASQEIEEAYVKNYVRQFGCAVSHDVGVSDLYITLIDKGRVATDSGWVEVGRVEFLTRRADVIAYMATSYLAGQCPVGSRKFNPFE